MLPCRFFQTGQCGKTSEECQFPHTYATEEEKKQLARMGRRRTPSPGAKKGPCLDWCKKGSCSWGDSCRFKHDPQAKGKGVPAAPVETPEPKAKAKAKGKAKAKAEAGN